VSIPFNRLCPVGTEFGYVQQAIDQMHTAGDGPFTRKCQSILEAETGASKVLLTTSCTHALEMSALLLRIQDGDEVILPSFTFVSTANAFVLRGARPIFVDIRPDTLNMDENLVERAITSRTRAIVPVHYAGVGCEMDAILRIAGAHGIAVVEDNAHGLFGSYRGRPLGSFGCMATLSFHETKNCTCGEGGALVINSPDLIERAEILREKGTNRSRFFRGQVDKYTWVDIGSSYLPSDLLAAFLFAQLEARQQIQAKRRAVWERYSNGLQAWACDSGVRIPMVPAHCQQAFHMFYLLMPSVESRHDMIGHLRQRGIMSVFHYQPLHLSEVGRGHGGQAGDCPVTESVSDRLLRLPFFNDLEPAAQDSVIAATCEFAFDRALPAASVA
jgi:dTDP-4-amino-4,6-dideoxygalactose transaminase